jgi:hypothetical protein
MKAISAQLLVVSLGLSMLVGCGEKGAGSTTTNEPSVPVASEPADAVQPLPAASSNIASEYVAPLALAAGGHCFLDAVNGAGIKDATAKVGQEVSFGGWVVDVDNQVPTTALFVLEGENKSYSIPLVAGADRPDVAAALANEALNKSGYNIIAKLDNVVPGEYALAIILGPGLASRCELNAKIVITD